MLDSSDHETLSLAWKLSPHRPNVTPVAGAPQQERKSSGLLSVRSVTSSLSILSGDRSPNGTGGHTKQPCALGLARGDRQQRLEPCETRPVELHRPAALLVPGPKLAEARTILFAQLSTQCVDNLLAVSSSKSTQRHTRSRVWRVPRSSYVATNSSCSRRVVSILAGLSQKSPEEMPTCNVYL